MGFGLRGAARQRPCRPTATRRKIAPFRTIPTARTARGATALRPGAAGHSRPLPPDARPGDSRCRGCHGKGSPGAKEVPGRNALGGSGSMFSHLTVDFFLRKFKIVFLTGMTYAALC